MGVRVFSIVGGSSDSAYYSSREGAHPPELVIVTGGGGGGNAPQVNFAAAPTSGAAPLQTVFTDLTVGQVTSWRWTFGDGGTSTARNPAHTYQANGTYSVSLSVSGPNGSGSLTKDGLVHVSAVATRGIWTSAQELAALPMSGSAWSSLLATANRSASAPLISNQDDAPTSSCWRRGSSSRARATRATARKSSTPAGARWGPRRAAARSRSGAT
jgi:PKD repeat protein